MVKKTTTKKKAVAEKNADIKVLVQNLAGKKMGEMEAKGVNDVKVADILLAQIVNSNRDRQRIRRAHTKERGEVRGGGKKPWRQKGTGRARHASRRSPIWVGGGITFGPRAQKSAKLFVPKEMKRKAIAAVVANHIKSGSLIVIEADKDIPVKTKELAKQIGRSEKVLIVSSGDDKLLRRSAGNLSYVKVEQATQVSLDNLLQAKRVWVLTQAIKDLEERMGSKVTLAQVTKKPKQASKGKGSK